MRRCTNNSEIGIEVAEIIVIILKVISVDAKKHSIKNGLPVGRLDVKGNGHNKIISVNAKKYPIKNGLSVRRLDGEGNGKNKIIEFDAKKHSIKDGLPIRRVDVEGNGHNKIITKQKIRLIKLSAQTNIFNPGCSLFADILGISDELKTNDIQIPEE